MTCAHPIKIELSTAHPITQWCHVCGAYRVEELATFVTGLYGPIHAPTGWGEWVLPGMPAPVCARCDLPMTMLPVVTPSRRFQCEGCGRTLTVPLPEGRDDGD